MRPAGSGGRNPHTPGVKRDLQHATGHSVGHIRQRANGSGVSLRPVRARSAHERLAEELGAWQLVLPPTAAFSHLTAAEVRGWWLPAPIAHPVFAAVTTRIHGVERPACCVCRHRKPVAMQRHHGLRLTTPRRDMLAAARDLGVLDLVIMGDSALRLEHCTLTDLEDRGRPAPAGRSPAAAGHPAARQAQRVSVGVDHARAPPGSRDPVTPQQEIFDDRSAASSLGPTCWIDGTRRLHEYDGAMHREG